MLHFKFYIYTYLGKFWYITYSKGHRETSFHPFVLSSICPSVWSSIHLIMVCLLRRGGERVAENNIYISVVNFYFYVYFLFWGFWTSVHSSCLFLNNWKSSVGLFFFSFLKFYLKYWKFLMLFTLPYFFIIVQWMWERAAIKHNFIRYWQFQGLHLP